MKYEVEQKFPVEQFELLRERLAQMNVAWRPVVQQVDTYFRHPVRDFATTDEALRVRRVGDSNCVTYKGPKVDAETKTRHEIEIPLGPGSQTHEGACDILTALGFAVVAQVVKLRTVGELVWQGHHVELALDDVQHVGRFVELETQADEAALPVARQAIQQLARELGLEATERRSYLEMLLANGGRGN